MEQEARANDSKKSMYDGFYGLSPSQYNALKKAFDGYKIKANVPKIRDTDLRKVLKSIGWNPKEQDMVEMLVTMDPSDSKKIDFHTFMKIMSEKMGALDLEEDLKEAFRVLDIDNNGVITTQEFRHIMSNAIEDLPEQELEEMIGDFDEDGNGTIDYNELAYIARAGKAFNLQKLENLEAS